MSVSFRTATGVARGCPQIEVEVMETQSITPDEQAAVQAARSEATRPGTSVPASWWQSWGKTADFVVLGAWIAVAGFTLHYHEKWADEAQAWLLARDLDLRTLWFRELRYEGSPGLWHTLLWVAQHVFHARYSSLGTIGMCCATAGVALMLFKAPFPRPIRWMLAFSYFLVYQYAVIARPYVLLPLFSFAAAIFFKDVKHPGRITLALVLLANLSIHGAIMAAAFGFAYLIDAIKAWSTLEQRERSRLVLYAGVLALTFVFLLIILKPTPDVEVLTVKKDPAKYHVVPPAKLAQLEWVVSGATMDYVVPSVAFLLLTGTWCFTRRRLLTFALPTGLLILLYMFYGAPHHQGTVFVAIITGLWIAWPTDEERQNFSSSERRIMQGITALFTCLLIINAWDAAASIRSEYKYPYSGAEDAARYLTSAGAVGKSISGYMYGVAGVQAYFDHNILSNMPTAYYHHGTPLYGRVLDSDEISAAKPQYLIVHSLFPNREYARMNPFLNSLGYQLAHFSDGYSIYKRTFYERQSYFIYRRVE
jgi:hypothetical protein